MSHPLIHTYARQVLLEAMRATQQTALLARLVAVLTEHFPEVDYAAWQACERLVPHIQASAAQLEQLSTALVDAADLFGQAGRYVRDRARWPSIHERWDRSILARKPSNGTMLVSWMRNNASSSNSRCDLKSSTAWDGNSVWSLSKISMSLEISLSQDEKRIERQKSTLARFKCREKKEL